MRGIAQSEGKVPSTVMRQIRKVESDRDDPLYEKAIQELVGDLIREWPDGFERNREEYEVTFQHRMNKKLSNPKLERDARRILRRLCEQNTFLLVSPKLEKAAVFREAKTGGELARLAVFSRDVAQEFILRDWVQACQDRVSVATSLRMQDVLP